MTRHPLERLEPGRRYWIGRRRVRLLSVGQVGSMGAWCRWLDVDRGEAYAGLYARSTAFRTRRFGP